MTSFLYGMLGAVVVDGALVVAAALAAPRLIRRAMRARVGAYTGAFAKKPAGAD